MLSNVKSFNHLVTRIVHTMALLLCSALPLVTLPNHTLLISADAQHHYMAQISRAEQVSMQVRHVCVSE